MITGEEHWNKRYGHRYVYYRCTRRKIGYAKCEQPYIGEKDLIAQMEKFLEGIYLPDKLLEWAFQRLDKMGDEEEEQMKTVRLNLEKTLQNVERKLKNLTEMRLNEMITNEEYLKTKEKLLFEQQNLKEKLNDSDTLREKWIEPAGDVILVANQAASLFKRGADDDKKVIMKSVASNLFLKDKILQIQAKIPFEILKNRRQFFLSDSSCPEPLKMFSFKQESELQETSIPSMWTILKLARAISVAASGEGKPP